MKKIIETLFFNLFLIFPMSAAGVETFQHPSCLVHLHPFSKKHNYDESLIRKLKSKLDDKGYKTRALDEYKKLVPGEFHLELKRTLTGKLYKECLIEIIVKKARSNTALENDPIFYKMEKSRRFPRQTLKGKERCYLAIDDAIYALNICKQVTN